MFTMSCILCPFLLDYCQCHLQKRHKIAINNSSHPRCCDYITSQHRNHERDGNVLRMHGIGAMKQVNDIYMYMCIYSVMLRVKCRDEPRGPLWGCRLRGRLNLAGQRLIKLGIETNVNARLAPDCCPGKLTTLFNTATLRVIIKNFS